MRICLATIGALMAALIFTGVRAQTPRIEIGRQSSSPFEKTPTANPRWFTAGGETFSCQLGDRNVEEVKSVNSWLKQADGNFQLKTESGREYFIQVSNGETCQFVSRDRDTRVTPVAVNHSYSLPDEQKSDFVCYMYVKGRNIASFKKRVFMASQNRYNGVYTLVLDITDGGAQTVIYPPRAGEICEIK